MTARRALSASVLVLATACESRSGDQAAPRDPGALGPGQLRIRDITNPTLPEHASYLVPDVSLAVAAATVVAVDNFDETQNGRSVGTIYVQDLGAAEPYSGISLFAPAFVPGNLRVGPGDVLDLRGPYQENANIGTAVFAPGAVLPQLARPTATFRLEVDLASTIEPAEIDVAELADFERGRRWLGMLVRIKNVTLQTDAIASTTGRVAAELKPRGAGASATTACEDPFPKPPALTNELFDVGALGLRAGTTIASVTGVVVFFCNLHVAPRSAADIVR